MSSVRVFKKNNDRQINETWKPIIAEYGINEAAGCMSWLPDYCHNHAMWDNGGTKLFESETPGLLYQVPGSISAIGAPAAPTRSQTPWSGMNQTTIGNSGSGDKFPTLMPIAIQVAAKTIGFDLISVIPMDAPVGFIPYLDYVYAGGNLDTSYPPFLIKLDQFDPATGSVASPAVAFTTHATPGSNWVVYNASPAAVTGKFKFVGYSRVDGSPVFRVIELVNDGATVKGVFIASGAILALCAGTTYTPTTATYALTGSNNTVDLVSALENQISGFTSTASSDTDAAWSGNYLPSQNNDGSISGVPDSMTREQGEQSSYRQIGLRMFTKFVEAKTDQVALSATVEQIQDFNRVWNFDVISMLENVGVNDIAQNVNKRLVKRTLELGAAHTKKVNVIEGADTTTLDLTAGGGFENTSTLQRKVVTKVLEMANLIYHRGRWGAGEYLVTNGRVASSLNDAAGYSIATAPINAASGAGQLYPAGKVYGLQVYVDPNLKWGDNRILVGRKGKDDEPGIKFLPYIMAETLQTVSEGTFSPKIGIKSRYAITEAGWHPETQYILMQVSGLGKLTASAPAVPA